MVNDLKEKLREELSKEIVGEPQVVYILSRVRKILETKSKKGEFKVLKFYCDWALHSEIENTDAVREILDGIVAGRDEPRVEFFLFNPFHQEFRLFLEKYNLLTAIHDMVAFRHRFNKFLSQIYTDTPLVIKDIKRTKITWQGSPPSEGLGYGGRYDVEKEA